MENRKPLKVKLVLFVFLSVIFVFISNCSGSQWVLFHDKEIKGYVVDTETGKPIEGAIVVAMWRLSQIGSQGFGGYAKIILAKTDKEGKFAVPSWIAFKPWTANSVMHELAPEIVIYKPGYKLYSSHRIMREGYPYDISKTEEEKMKLKEEYSINPAKLKRIFMDEEIWMNFSEFESKRPPYEYYSKNQLRYTFDYIEIETMQLPNSNNKVKEKILKDINEYKEYWVEGKK